MRVVPATVTERTTGSEAKVSRLLCGIQWGAAGVALHSLNLAESEHKRWGEIDFVLVGSPGILVIEVKGGDVSCRDGIWQYQDGFGRTVRRHESPLVQSKSAYFALMERYLLPRFGRELDTIATGFCAILAGATRKSIRPFLGSPEFPPDLWGCRDDVGDKGKLQAFIGRALAHWRERGNGKRGTLPDAVVNDVVSYLRPSFERVQPLSLALARVRQEQVELTQDQYNCLDHWEGARRLLVTGPAGCGKTFIAVEMVRRAVADGARVLLVTGTEGLALDLARHAFPKAAALSPFSRVHEQEARPPFDLLIVDEGQLALSDEGLGTLDRLVDGGLAGGRWAWFGDPTFQGNGSPGAEASLGRLRIYASVTPRLQQNCRNTPQVVAAVELCSGAPIGHALVKGAGPAVEYLDTPTVATVPALAATQLKKWVDAKVELQEILLLLGGGEPEAIAAEVGRVANLPVSPWHRVREGTVRSLGWASVDEFRGLEAPFVLLSGLDYEMPDADLQRLLYAGMSRPNLGLAVAVTTKTMERIRAFNAETSARLNRS